jgi:cell division protein FtsB
MPARDFKASTYTHLFWRFLLALGAAGVLLFVGAASVKATWEMYQTFDVAAAERAVTEAELASLRAEYAQMAAILEGFSSPRGFEAAVRERFGMVRPEEGVIRIIRTEEGVIIKDRVDPNPFSQLFNALFTW